MEEVARSDLSPWRGQHREFATLLPADGDPWLKVQRVGGEGGIHLDLDVEGPLPEAAEQAVRLGAAVVGDLGDVIVCRSPGGFVFCLTRWSQEHSARGQARASAPSLIDQVCLDVPSSGYAAEVAFWSQLTGGRSTTPTPTTSSCGWPGRAAYLCGSCSNGSTSPRGPCAGTSTSPPSTAWPRSSATGASAHTKRVQVTAGRSCGARPATGTASLIGTRVKGRREHPDGKHADRKRADGKRTDGKHADGKRTDGKRTDSKRTGAASDMPLTPRCRWGVGRGHAGSASVLLAHRRARRSS